MNASTIDLRPDLQEIVYTILHEHVPDREVWVFGSRAKGKAKKASDLDLAILGDMPLDVSTLAALRDAFSESDLPFKVDIVDWAKTSDTFQKIIEKQKVLLQKA